MLEKKNMKKKETNNEKVFEYKWKHVNEKKNTQQLTNKQKKSLIKKYKIKTIAQNTKKFQSPILFLFHLLQFYDYTCLHWII